MTKDIMDEIMNGAMDMINGMTPEDLRRFADMFGIPASDEDLERALAQLKEGGPVEKVLT